MADDWDWGACSVSDSGQQNYSQPQSNYHSDQQSNWRDNNGESRTFGNSRGRRGFSRGGGDGHRPNNRNHYDAGDEITIKVPSRFVGRIIGRGGSKIQDLQQESGARINVSKETEGDETIIKLSGSNDEVAKAEEMIRELTIDRDRDYGGSSRVSEKTSHQSSNTWGANNDFSSTAEQADNSEPEKPKASIKDWAAFLKECDEASAAEWAKLPPIQKQFYTEHPEVTNLTEEQVENFRTENNNIVVDRTFKKDDSKPCPKPVLTFEHAFFNYPEILEEMRKAGFEKPSPIQCQAWPVLLSGEDLIGIAQTGTGKTLAFLLPALIHIDGQVSSRAERKGPAVLVMAPTRELALQIDKEVKKYEYKGINAVCIYGGASRRDQIKIVTGGVDIVIATPGRLNDLVEAGHLNVQYVTYVVLDEADRMLDMGFEPQIRKVMYSIRPSRQTVMTSATWPVGVRRLAQSYMVDPIQIYVGTLDLAATHTVTQIIEILPDSDEEKMNYIKDFVNNLNADDKVIIFCGKKSRADELSSELTMAGISVQTIHGDRDQADREQALVDIKDGTVQILIATDVASRGLDIDDITYVVNFDFPRNIEEYVHRVGRTGRAGKSGKSISLVTRADWGQCKDLINILEEAQQYVPEEICKMAERYAVWKEKKDSEKPQGRKFGGGGGGGRRW